MIAVVSLHVAHRTAFGPVPNTCRGFLRPVMSPELKHPGLKHLQRIISRFIFNFKEV